MTPYSSLIILLVVSFLALPSGAGAQEVADPDGVPQIAERCRGAEHRQFDFWIGEWEVRNPHGELVGHNEIRRVSRGCALLENWQGVGGGRGMSINSYDADRGAWTQRWVGAGATLWLEGAFAEGRMVLAGAAPRSTPDGPVLDRLTWTPLPDGRVRQLWEVSADDGRSWRAIFEGFYGARP